MDAEELVARIRALRKNLTSIVDVEHGLLSHLFDRGILSDDQVEVIQSEKIHSRQVGLLLDDVAHLSSDQVSDFVQSLDDTQQTHVSNYIRANGCYAEEYGDNWPLHCNEKVIVTLTRNRSAMVELIDCDLGLLDDMLTLRCINDQQNASVKAGETSSKKSERLLKIVQRRSVNDFNNFIVCLLRTKQNAVAALLVPDKLGEDMLPVSKEVRSRMTARHSTLLDNLNAADGLLNHLLANDCITRRQKEFIELGATSWDKNERLLAIVKRSSQSGFLKLIDCLSENQYHVCRLLMEDGAAPELVSVNIGSRRSDDEVHIILALMNLLKRSPENRRTDVRNDLIKVIEKFPDDCGAELLAMKQTRSITLLWLCCSKAGLFRFHETYMSGKLKTMIEELFLLALKCDRSTFHTDRLEWLTSNYLSCTQCFATLETLSVDHLTSRRDVLVDDQSAGLWFDQWHCLPIEIAQMLVVRAAGHLFASLSKFAPQIKSRVLTTLGSVSLQWWQILTYSKSDKRLLRRYMENFCIPFECCPQRLQGIDVPGGYFVSGMAELHDNLYIACYGSTTIHVYNRNPPFVELEQFEVEGLSDTYDIVICTETAQLYIADRYSRCIWRLSILEKGKPTKFIFTKFLPYSMSIRYNQVLATPFDGDFLHVFDANGDISRTIDLPKHLFARHALQTDRDTFIVCHVNRLVGDLRLNIHGVSEMDAKANVIHSFKCQHGVFDVQPFDWPRYLVLLDDGQVIVADMLGRRVVLLGSDLQMKRVLMTSLEGQPLRICLSRKSGLLFIVNYKSANIGVCRVGSKPCD